MVLTIGIEKTTKVREIYLGGGFIFQLQSFNPHTQEMVIKVIQVLDDRNPRDIDARSDEGQLLFPQFEFNITISPTQSLKEITQTDISQVVESQDPSMLSALIAQNFINENFGSIFNLFKTALIIHPYPKDLAIKGLAAILPEKDNGEGFRVVTTAFDFEGPEVVQQWQDGKPQKNNREHETSRSFRLMHLGLSVYGCLNTLFSQQQELALALNSLNLALNTQEAQLNPDIIRQTVSAIFSHHHPEQTAPAALGRFFRYALIDRPDNPPLFTATQLEDYCLIHLNLAGLDLGFVTQNGQLLNPYPTNLQSLNELLRMIYEKTTKEYPIKARLNYAKLGD